MVAKTIKSLAHEDYWTHYVAVENEAIRASMLTTILDEFKTHAAASGMNGIQIYGESFAYMCCKNIY